jgi:hypothetical protein
VETNHLLCLHVSTSPRLHLIRRAVCTASFCDAAGEICESQQSCHSPPALERSAVVPTATRTLPQTPALVDTVRTRARPRPSLAGSQRYTRRRCR